MPEDSGRFALLAFVQGQAEVGNVRPVFLIDEDVRGLQIAMHETLPMGVGHALRHRGHNLDRPHQIGEIGLHHRAQRAAVDEFHDEERRAVGVAARVVNRHDTWCFRPAAAGLVQQLRNLLGGIAGLGRQGLERTDRSRTLSWAR